MYIVCFIPKYWNSNTYFTAYKLYILTTHKTIFRFCLATVIINMNFLDITQLYCHPSSIIKYKSEKGKPYGYSQITYIYKII